MIKKNKLASYSVHKMDAMNRATALISKRGLQFDANPKCQQVVMPTSQGKVVYYPLRGEYQHGMIRGYVDNTESMIAYIVKCGVINTKKIEGVKVEILAYGDKSFAEILEENPVEVIASMDFSATDKPVVIEHKIAVCKGYGHAISRCNNIQSQLPLDSKERAEIFLYVSRITSYLARLRQKYPFLNKGGAGFSECLLSCLKEDVSETVWRSYVDRAHQKMIDIYFHGAER